MNTSSILWIIGAFFFAAILSFGVTPFAKKFAYKIGAIDVPKDERRMHKKPIPRLGGFAIFIAFIISSLLFGIEVMTNELRGGLIGGLIIVCLGIFDDVLALKPSIKGLVQIFAVIVPVIFGVRIEYLPNIFTNISEPFIKLPIVLQYIITCIWIMLILNAVNLIDGLDGLACGQSSIMSICLVAVSILMSDFTVGVVAACLAGACVGFLPYNLNPAKMFMGDTGAMFIGYTLAILSITGLFKNYEIVAFTIPILIMGLPIFDMGFVAIRRVLNGKSPFHADKTHIHHKLIDLGCTQKRAVAILYSVSAVLSLCAILLVGQGVTKIIASVIFVIFIAIIGFLLLFKKKNEKEDTQNEN